MSAMHDQVWSRGGTVAVKQGLSTMPFSGLMVGGFGAAAGWLLAAVSFARVLTLTCAVVVN